MALLRSISTFDGIAAGALFEIYQGESYPHEIDPDEDPGFDFLPALLAEFDGSNMDFTVRAEFFTCSFTPPGSLSAFEATGRPLMQMGSLVNNGKLRYVIPAGWWPDAILPTATTAVPLAVVWVRITDRRGTFEQVTIRPQKWVIRHSV